MQAESNNASWHVARRWHAYEGEIRVAILRLGLVLILYSIHLITYFLLEDSKLSSDTAESASTLVDQHRYFTLLAAGGLLISLGVLVALRQRFFPWCLSYIVTSLDTGLIFAAGFFGAQAQSPVVQCLALVVAMSAMRFSLRLVWFSSILALVAYFGLVGSSDSSWFDADHRTPLQTQMITALTIIATGIIAGQIVRMSRSAAELYTSHTTRHAAPKETVDSVGETST